MPLVWRRPTPPSPLPRRKVPKMRLEKHRKISSGILRWSHRRCFATTPRAVSNRTRSALHPESPGQERRRVLPDAGLTVAEHDYNNVAPRPRTACDEAMPGRFRVAGLHSVAIGQPLQDFVRVFQFASAAIRIAKHEIGQANDRTNGAVRVGRLG